MEFNVLDYCLCCMKVLTKHDLLHKKHTTAAKCWQRCSNSTGKHAKIYVWNFLRATPDYKSIKTIKVKRQCSGSSLVTSSSLLLLVPWNI